MADSDAPKAAASSSAAAPAATTAGAEDTALDQPGDAVKLTAIDPTRAAEDSKKDKLSPEDAAATGIDPAYSASENDETNSESNADPPIAREAKGKEKVEPIPENETVPRDNSLSIDPAPDANNPLSPTESSPNTRRTCNITLLLANGMRHPYRINEQYLTKKEVEIPEKDDEGKPDPFSISVCKLKELILGEWRPEWENVPRDPGLIRLIHLGRMLDDKEPLKKYRLNPDERNIIHMNVRPAEMVDEEEAAKAAGGGRTQGNYPGSGCCCVIL